MAKTIEKIIVNCAFMQPYDGDVRVDVEPRLVYRFVMPGPGAVLMGETDPLDGYPYIVTQEIGSIIEQHAYEDVDDAFHSPMVWNMKNYAKAYEEFLYAKKNGHPVLNVPFEFYESIDSHELEDFKAVGSMALSFKICVNFKDEPTMNAERENWINFNYMHPVGQCGNWVLLQTGKIGWVNWMGLMPDAENMIRYNARVSKNFRYESGAWTPIVEIPFIANETGWLLPCPQYKTFEDLTEAAKEWNEE